MKEKKLFKFRAWDKNNQRWMTPEIEDVEESEIRLDLWGNLEFKPPWWEQGDNTIHQVNGSDMFDIMQSTGLKDKNGLEIFEGDILKHIDFKSNKCNINVVYMKHGSLVFDIEVNESIYDVPVYKIHPEASKTYEGILEVIGNLYENPRLIEGTKGIDY